MKSRKIACHLVLICLFLLVTPAIAAYTGPCPIGTNGAPELRDTGLSSGALCRGACGSHCPAHRCNSVEDQVVVINKGTADQAICTYTNVVMCDSHAGCREHDDCYDYCTESQGESNPLGECHGFCNNQCFDTYGYTNCGLWADMPGSVINALGTLVDYSTAPSFDKSIFFSDAPTLTPKPVTTTTTATVTTAESTDEEDSPFSEILKDKPKVQNGAEDWIKEAERARRRGDYEGAIQCYDAAEAIFAGGYKDKASRPASVDESLASIEGYKAGIYANWPGHDTERKEAFDNSKQLLKSAEDKKKASSWDLPGFEAPACLMAFGLLFIVWRRKK